MNDVATQHLRAADPVMRALIDRIGPLDEEARRRGRPDDAYGALLRAIVGQQLSTSAARSIYARLIELFGGHVPAPAELLAVEPDALRAAGLSRAKVAYLRDLAERVEAGELELDRFSALPDEEVSAQLLAVKGLGRWTVDMFLMFHLRRPDVARERRPRHPAGRRARLRAAHAPEHRGRRAHRRAVAAAPDDGVPVPLGRRWTRCRRAEKPALRERPQRRSVRFPHRLPRFGLPTQPSPCRRAAGSGGPIGGSEPPGANRRRSAA